MFSNSKEEVEEDASLDLGNKQFLVALIFIFFGGNLVIERAISNFDQYCKTEQNKRIEKLYLQRKLEEQPQTPKLLELASISK